MERSFKLDMMERGVEVAVEVAYDAVVGVVAKLDDAQDEDTGEKVG